MTTTIRTFQPGDDVAQVSIYNEAAAALPRFKPATLDDVRRRLRDPDFDPATRLFALEGGRPAGYVTLSRSGRVGHPWCRRGKEHLAGPLFERALEGLGRLGVTRAIAAYRADWEAVRAFFADRGFAPVREMISFVMDLVEMPTPAARTPSVITPLTEEDVPAVLELGRGVLRGDEGELRRHLFDNLYFPPSSLFALRPRSGAAPAAVGLLVTSSAFADPKAVDANMPCFRLGAFGTEGLTHKRINGLFSVLARDDRDLMPLALDLLGHANRKLEDADDVAALAAQVPSDAAHLVRFYSSLFRRQGAFPVYERAL